MSTTAPRLALSNITQRGVQQLMHILIRVQAISYYNVEHLNLD